MIVKMTKYDIVLFAAEREQFIERLRDIRLVDITTTGWEPAEADRQLLADIESRQKALDFLTAFAASDDYTASAPRAEGSAYAAYTATQADIATAKSEIARLTKVVDEWSGWGDFSVDTIKRLADAGVHLRYFTTQKSTFDKNEAEWSAQYTIALISTVDSIARFVVIGDGDVAIDAQEQKAPAMSVSEAEQAMRDQIATLRRLNTALSACADARNEIAEELATLKMQLQDVRIGATAEQAADGMLLVMEGWAAKETSAQVDAVLDNCPNVIYIKSEPTPQDDTPVQLKNNWFARIFEFVGNMYALPKYGTIDLTPFFAPFYMLFFGICLNDAGYGLILLVLGLALLRRSTTPTMRQASLFATMCAVSTILFGCFCGSFFGMSMQEWFPSVHFFDFQGKFFSVALAIGIVQILFGMVLKIVLICQTVGAKHSLSALGWFIVLLSASLAAGLPMFGVTIPYFTASSPAFYGAVGLGLALMLLFNSPGRNIFVNIGAGLWETYNNITGILSDVLSYIRLFAIGLSGGVLALVFNSLAAGFVPDDANIAVRILIMLPILLIGHGINLFMSTISSFVHPMRLTFVEFYKNAGFEMSMRPFEPLRRVNQTNN